MKKSLQTLFEEALKDTKRPAGKKSTYEIAKKKIDERGGVDYLKRQRWEHITKKQIAKKLEISVPLLQKYLQEHKVHYSDFPKKSKKMVYKEVTIDDVRKLKNEGLSAKEVSFYLNFNRPDSVYNFCIKRGTRWRDL